LACRATAEQCEPAVIAQFLEGVGSPYTALPERPRVRPCAAENTHKNMMSVVVTTMLAGSAMGITLTKVAPPMQPCRPAAAPALVAINRFECGCGGAGCPMCGGQPVFKSEPIADRFECGCGGTGCPMCGGQPIFEMFSAGVANSQSECGCGGTGCPMCGGQPIFEMLDAKSAVNRFDCGVCGGMSEACPVCRGPSAPIFEVVIDGKSEPKVSFGCGCGGTGCPTCGGQPIFQA